MFGRRWICLRFSELFSILLAFYRFVTVCIAR